MDSLFYSERSASTGSAWQLDAGYVPKKRPTLKATIRPLITVPQCTELGSENAHVMALATSTPHKTQMAPPITENRRRFNQKLKQNIAAARPQRFPHSDFAGPLGHGHQHDVS